MNEIRTTGNGEVAANNTANVPEKRSVQGEIILPPRVGPLNKLAAIRREQARCYRRTVRGDLPSTEGRRRIDMLSMIAKTLELEQTERRIDLLEEAVFGGVAIEI